MDKTYLNPSMGCAVDGCSNKIYEGLCVIIRLDELRTILLCEPCHKKLVNG